MIKRILFLLIFVGLFAACDRQTNIATPASTEKTTVGLEIIVFTWDWPMMANIPPVHVWKDNHAMWVDWKEVESLQYHWTVYETYLSPDEALKVEDVLKNSGFWEDEQQKAIISDASNFVLWASLSGKEKSVTVSKGKYETTISSLRGILEASPSKTEYFPKQGYLFTTQAESYLAESGFPWPSKENGFDFSKHEQGTFVDGETLSTIWMAVQQGYFGITYQGNAYDYSLRIPGVSCVISDDPYMCNMYAAETR